jgi:hypothetical protein
LERRIAEEKERVEKKYLLIIEDYEIKIREEN